MTYDLHLLGILKIAIFDGKMLLIFEIEFYTSF